MKYVCKNVSAGHFKNGFGIEVSRLPGSLVENLPQLGEQGAAITKQQG